MTQNSQKITGVKPKRTFKAIKSSSPLISVIIPVYNSRETLLPSLSSVQNQTYSNLEIILVDDGSTDDSGELCDKFARADSRIKVIHQENRGLSAARNAGIDLSSGEYLAFVDSDDTIAPEMVSALYCSLSSNYVKLSACNFQEVKELDVQQPLPPQSSLRPLPSQASLQPPLQPISQPPSSAHMNSPEQSNSNSASIYSQAEALTLMLGEKIPIMSCGKLYARELFAEIRFPVGKLYEDVGTTYRLILECEKIAYLPEPYYHYYQNPTSIIHQTFRPEKLSLISLTDNMCDDIAKNVHPLTEPLSNALRVRRCHARFSILRQLVLVKPQTAEIKSLEREMVSYLKSHQSDILKNPASTRRDRLAMRSLLLGLPIFTVAWKAYSHRKR